MTRANRGSQRQERRERRAARQHQEREQAGRRRLRRRLQTIIPVSVLGLAVLAGVGYAIIDAVRFRPGESTPDYGRQHVQGGTSLNHPTYPPASGTHYFETISWRFYDMPVPPGNWLHNLEHGGVVLLYKCPADQAECDTLRRQLRGLHDSLPPSSQSRSVKLVSAPDDAIDTTIMALAWTRRLRLEAFEEEQIRGFYQAFVDRGPEAGT